MIPSIKRFQKHALALSLVTALTLGGLAGCAVPAGQVTSAAATQTQETVLSGELTSRSSINMNNGSRYERFNVRLAADTTTLFTLKSDFDGELTLIGKDGTVKAASADQQQRSGILTYSAVESGVYTLAVSGVDKKDYGPFTVETKTLMVRNNGTLAVNEDVYGVLTGQTRRRGNVYELNVATAAIYEISMQSDEIDSYLEVIGNGVRESDDDGGENTDARLLVYLEPGTYQVKAKAQDSGKGHYILNVSTEPLPANFQNRGTINIGSDVKGMLLGTQNTYQLHIESQGYYEIKTESDLDTYLELSGNDFNLKNDDGGSDNNARIYAQLKPGVYELVVRGYDSSEQGEYTLLADVKDLPASTHLQNSGVLRLNQEIHGFLNGSIAIYTINVPRRSQVTIDLKSSDFDSVLAIKGQDIEEEDDDGGSDSNARISRMLNAGRYEIIVRSYGEENSGLFSLQATVGNR